MIRARPTAASRSTFSGGGSRSGSNKVAIASGSAVSGSTTSPTTSTSNNKVQQQRRRKLRRMGSSSVTASASAQCLGIAVFCGSIVILIAFSYLVISPKHSIVTPKLVESSASIEYNVYPPEYPIIHWNGPSKEAVTLSKEALEMCTRTLWHTLETTTIVLPSIPDSPHEYERVGGTFVHTGDIDDLWIRDSAAQVHPLVAPLLLNAGSLLQQDARIHRVVAGLIRRCAFYIRHDPYANAFRIDDTYQFNAMQKALGRHDLISTWNYELDSGCYFIRLVWYYWKATAENQAKSQDSNAVYLEESVKQAMELMVDLWKAEQRHEEDAVPTGPLFDCLNCHKPYRYPELKIRQGKGSPTNATAGLTWTGFRPSDDACKYHYLIPANMFAVVALEYVVELAQQVWKDEGLATKAHDLAQDIQRGIQEHAIVDHVKYGKIYAYEVDGLGNYHLMDDANIPSLLSIPYLGYRYYDREIYENTKRFIFSRDNPYYQKGTNRWTGEIEGYGSPHAMQDIAVNIWPMSLAMQGLVSQDVDEKIQLVETLVQATAGTGWMHESIDVRNPSRYTRPWFCWADSLFAELVLSLTDDCPLPHHEYVVHQWRDPVLPPGGPYAGDQPITNI